MRTSLLLGLMSLMGLTLSGKYKFESVHYNIPLDTRKETRGNDRWVNDEQILAIADGQENPMGNSAEFAENLIQNIQNFVRIDEDKYCKNPKELLIEVDKNTKVNGASTLILMTIDQQAKKLKSANYGDSGYFLMQRLNIREGYRYFPIYHSKPLEHYFNQPAQLGTEIANSSMAIEVEHEIKGGELIIMYSDGVRENLFRDDLRDLVKKASLTDFDSISLIAQLIAEKALEISKKRNIKTPFSLQARKKGFEYQGGREDDITVIVARVVEK